MHSLTVYDYGFRIYNPAIGRFLSVDPLMQSFPWYTPYQFAGNKPITAVDLDGKEELDYRLYRNGMLKGETQLKLIPFPKVDPTIWQDPNVYKDNEYWKPAPQALGTHPSTLELQPGKSPSQGIMHIYNNPEKYTMECGQFVQVVKLYGMLQSMGATDFDKYLTGDGKYLKYRFSNQESPGVEHKEVVSYSKQEGTWFDNSSERPDYDPVAAMSKAEIGSEGVFSTDALKGTVFANENFVKVGDNQYLAQGLNKYLPEAGQGPLTLVQIQQALVNVAKEAGKTITTEDVKFTEVRETAAEIKNKEK